MNNIIEPNNNFDFDHLSLAHPTGVQGGAYFTKILHNNKSLYIQTPKCLTRQGFVKSGKKYYSDLMFDNNAADIINWFECLEERCQKLIYEKADTWFQNALEMTDVESAFNSIIRIYKSGKYYLVRANIKNSVNHEPIIKIYDENERVLKMEDITTETNIISILEIQGIKFTSRNFQIEIELKQMMVLNDEIVFDNCLIKTSKSENVKQDVQKDDHYSEKNKIDIIDVITDKENGNNLENDNINTFIEGIEKDLEQSDISKLDLEKSELSNKDTEEKDLDPINILDIQDLNVENLEDDPDELKEVELTVDTNLDNSITLKKPNQVYFELYKKARDKAKMAKKAAIIAYLEAKNIKKTYMIENIDSSDNEFDQEIEEVSESELELF
jgi:hypothetical protein